MKDMGEVFEAMDRLNNELKGFKRDMDRRNEPLNRLAEASEAARQAWLKAESTRRGEDGPEYAAWNEAMAAYVRALPR